MKEGDVVDKNTKYLLIISQALAMLQYAFTIPIINQYFYSVVSSNTLAVANLSNVIFATVILSSFQDKKMIGMWRKYFIPITVIQLILFIVINLDGEHHPEVRLIGLSILNGSLMLIWGTLMNNMIQQYIGGDELTIFSAELGKYNKIASAFGYVLCMVYTVSVDAAIHIQIASEIIIAVIDINAWYRLKTGLVNIKQEKCKSV